MVMMMTIFECAVTKMVVAVRAVIIRVVYLLYFAVVVLAILGLILIFPYSLGNRTLFTRNKISIQFINTG